MGHRYVSIADLELCLPRQSVDDATASAAIHGARANVDAVPDRKDIFRSLPIEAFNALPRLSDKELQKALDAGRPAPIPGGGWNPRGGW